MASIIWTSPTGKTAMVEFDCTGSEEHTQAAEVTEHPVEVGADITDHVRPLRVKLNLTGTITNTPINSNITDTSFLVSDARPRGLVVGRPTPFTLRAPEVAKGGGAKKPGLTTSKQISSAQIYDGWVSPHKFPGFPRPHGNPFVEPGERTNVPMNVGGTSFQALTPQDRVSSCFEALFELCRTGREVRVVTSIREYAVMLISSISAPIAGLDSIDFSISLTEVEFATVAKGVEVRKRTSEKRAQNSAGTEQVLGDGYVFKGNPVLPESVLRGMVH